MKEDDLQKAWEAYRAKSEFPDLLNFEDFQAGFSSAMGGLEQFMRMKSRIRELEEKLDMYAGSPRHNAVYAYSTSSPAISNSVQFSDESYWLERFRQMRRHDLP